MNDLTPHNSMFTIKFAYTADAHNFSSVSLCSEPVLPIPVVFILQNAYSKLMSINALNMAAIDGFTVTLPTDQFCTVQ